MMQIHSAAVLGAGTMGAQIAAHLANAGVRVLLLDLDESIAAKGLKAAQQLKPDPAFTPDTWRLITVGGFDTHLARLGEDDADPLRRCARCRNDGRADRGPPC